MSNQVQGEIISKMKELNSPIMQHPGIGYTQGAALLSRIIGDINRFDSAKQLVAFAGLDPRIPQSGQFEAKRTRMSKRGSKILRHYAFYILKNPDKEFTLI